MIATEPGLGGWIETRDLYVQQAALAHNVTVAVTDSRFPRPPDTLVDRALWTQSQPIEASAYDSLDICADLFGLVRLLLADADAEDNSPAPHAAAAQIIDLAIDRTELFIDLLFQVRARPRLLADLVIHPPSAALACLLIAQWSSPAGAWDRGLVERDHQIGQAEAFTDAVAILGEHLRSGKTNASEAAALLNWLHRRAVLGFIDDFVGADSLIAALRRELAGCASSILLAMAQSLDGADLRRGVGASEFAAVLDLSELGGIEDEVDADTVVTAYAHSIATGDYSLSAHTIGAAGAAALARMSERAEALRSQFLYPLDVRARLTAAAPQDNEFTLADSIGRSLRTHIRILCRAVIGGAADTPADLFDALVATVRTGAIQHKEKDDASQRSPLAILKIASRCPSPTGLWPLTWRPPSPSSTGRDKTLCWMRSSKLMSLLSSRSCFRELRPVFAPTSNAASRPSPRLTLERSVLFRKCRPALTNCWRLALQTPPQAIWPQRLISRRGGNLQGANSPDSRTNSASISFGGTGRRLRARPIQTSPRHWNKQRRLILFANFVGWRPSRAPTQIPKGRRRCSRTSSPSVHPLVLLPIGSRPRSASSFKPIILPS